MLAKGPLLSLGDSLYKDHVPIFMLHRFNSSELGVKGHDASLLEFALQFLADNHFNFVTVDDIALAIRDKVTLPKKSIAFTLDDGYQEQIDVTADIFARFNCPATYFVTTGFVNGELWMWYDKVSYLVETCPDLSRLQAALPELDFSGLSKAAIADKIIFLIASFDYDSINQWINKMSEELAVDVPVLVPKKYQSTSWEKLRAIEVKGMKIGAHTYSHPLLSRESDERSMNEMIRSIDEVKSQVSNASNVFCYPVGRDVDFTDREENYLRDAGCLGAVSAMPGVVKTNNESSRFSMLRFGFPDNREDVIQYSTWIESFKNTLRGNG